MPEAQDIEDALDPLLRAFDEQLSTSVGGQLTDIYVSGSAQMMDWAGVPFEGPPIQQAIGFAQKRGALLVTEMDEETKRQLAQIVSDGIKNKRGVPGLSRDIRSQFTDMVKKRSDLIAKTETRQALFQASQDRMEDLGIDGKEWVLGAGGAEGNCPDCQANAAAGIIPVKQEFPISQAEIHPGCTCAIAPARLPR